MEKSNEIFKKKSIKINININLEKIMMYRKEMQNKIINVQCESVAIIKTKNERKNKNETKKEKGNA